MAMIGDVVVTGNRFYTEKRTEEGMEPWRFNLLSGAVGAAALGILAVLATIGITLVGAENPIRLTPAVAVTVAAPGEHMIVQHGISGDCPGAVGGQIIVEYKSLRATVWRHLKQINFSLDNLEPGKSLSTWKIPQSAEPGMHNGRITVRCYERKKPTRQYLAFNVGKK